MDDIDWKKLVPQQTTISRKDFEFLWEQNNNPPEPSPNLRKLIQERTVFEDRDNGERDSVPRNPPASDVGSGNRQSRTVSPKDHHG